ncbi:MAG TPA: flagellar biosynthesis protein FlhB [Sulfuricurvum sp.]|nr:flagellar biosynthesis protein FlhB [Sulfuricurvum sp.]
MAKDPSKTEKATPRRREKAREEGQVARSQDIPIAATLLGVFLIFVFYLPFATDELIAFYRRIFSDPLYFITTLNHQTMYEVVKMLGLLLAPVGIVLLVIGIVANIAQFGILLSFKPMMPKLDKLNPITGLQRIFSMKTLFELLRNVLKLAVASAIAYYLVSYLLEDVFSMASVSVNQQAYLMLRFTLIMVLAFALLSIPIAVVDFLYRRFDFEENIKMSKDEIKEEHKMMEGNPAIKAAVKQKQREMSMLRMMAEVSNSDVVIVNPEHFAVALVYEREQMQAPKVVAKGQDHVALRIKEVAKEHEIPIVENPPLARALYESCELDEFVPENLYEAIAKILAAIYKERGEKKSGV